MGVSKDQVCHIAHLARLNLSQDEIEYFSGSLSKIIGYIDVIKDSPELNIPNNSPLTPCEREDVVVPSIDPELATREAHKKQGSSFVVPRIIQS